MVAIGDTLPDARFVRMGEAGPEEVSLTDKAKGRRIVLVAVPGAFTPTCDARHLRSFVRTKIQFDAKGIDEILCISVNDAHVMRLWGETTGATAAGITLLADADSSFTRAMGMTYTKPEVGFHDRSRRYALVAEDGVITHLQVEQPGECAISTGEALLAVI
ncbi:Antioxidant, AhpC/Tsa family [Roseibacterium elongatum DSM 19469]|uniref:Glutathione-dependent peroxiredoxin n=1 Tax=Roseicyclus elongatus DSM 19469 TaxID=1294273 RepID=W8S4Q7_9RHOB|nr:peroxiredoxin [Roseibacterium elongatum]AHM03801.1 Antioxidant, AhpC/Tsa family [Roseibacterium elongatum DSM 19469]